MAPPRKVPPIEKIREEAPRHQTKASLAKALGVTPSSLSNVLGKEDAREEVTALLASSIPERSDGDESGPSTEEVQTERIRDLEAALRKRQKADVFTERVALALTEAVERRGLPKFSPRAIPKQKPAKGTHEFVLLWSDQHYGEVVSSEETNGLNQYDTKICWQRHEKLRQALFSYADNRPYEIRRLHVLALGDTLSGSIHGELKETNEVPLAEASVDFGDRGAEWLESLADRFAEIRFAGVVGNHPRFDQKPRAKGGFDNGDWISYHHMSLLLRNHPAFQFSIPKSNTHIHQVMGRNVLLGHGDQIRSSMPGVPWGGIVRRATALHAQYAQAGVPIDLYAFGHFHQRNLVKGPGNSRIVVNGSTKGVDEYSLKAFGGGEGPGQLLLTYHKSKGLTDASLIDL